MKTFDYFEPETVNEGVALLSKYKGGARAIAGGTDLLVTMKRGIVNPDCLVNIKKIPGLDSIDYDANGGFKIGALTTLRALETHPLIRERLNIMAQAAHQVAARRIRSVATVGGNLCQDSKCLYYHRMHLWGWAPCYRGGGDACYAVKGAKSCQAMAIAETAPALIALDAKARIAGPTGERTVSLEDFFISAGVTNLQEDEILLAIDIPSPKASTGGVYLKYSLRGPLDFAIAGAAVVLTLAPGEGTCLDAKIVLNGVARTPVRARRAEEIVKGNLIEENMIRQAAEEASKETHPLGDIYASAAYRRKLAGVLVGRATAQALVAARES